MTTAVAPFPNALRRFFTRKIGLQYLVVFTRQLATMLDAGLAVNRCLQVLGRQSRNKEFGRIIVDVKARIESGKSLSAAMHEHPQAFSELYVNLVKAGEDSGSLPVILGRLATYLEKSQALRRQVIGAMTYPAAILAIASLVVVVLLWKVIPVFENMFKDFGGAALPAPTQFVINMSQFVQHNILLIAAVVIGAFLAAGAVLKTHWGRKTADALLLKLPLIGSLLRKVAVARLARTLSTLQSSGVQILDALTTASKTAGNIIIADAIIYVREKVAEGKTIAEPLAETRMFPEMLVEMVQVGEETGNLDTMLSKTAEFFEEEIDVAVTALTKLMEPFMMVFLGGVVGGLLIAMYMPIFEMAGSIKAG